MYMCMYTYLTFYEKCTLAFIKNINCMHYFVLLRWFCLLHYQLRLEIEMISNDCAALI